MPATKVGSHRLNPSTTNVDANGWTITDLGSFKMYTKKMSTTLSGFNGPAFINSIATTLPVGVATHNAAKLVLASFHYGGSGNMRVVQEANGTNNGIAIVGTTSAAYSGTIEGNYLVIA